MLAVVSPAAPPPRRPRALPTAFLVAVSLIWVWVLLTSTGSTDRAVLVTEVAGAAALALTAVHAPDPRARWTIGLVGCWAGLSALGDSWWLLTAGSAAVSYARGQYEPTFTVAVFLLRYAALAVALALAVPHRTGAPRRAWSALGDALAPLQVAGGAAALVALTSPLGDLLDDGHPYSLFFACDLLVAAGAFSLVLRRALSTRRAPGRPARLATATAVGVACLCAADAGVVLGLVRGSAAAGAIGYTCALTGGAVVVVAHLRAGRVPAPAGSCLPPVPVTGRGTRLAARVLARLLLPLAVLVLTTAGAVLGLTGTGDGWPAALGGDRPVTTGLAVTALAFALADAVLRLVRADRAETTAATAVRDELTGAWSRRGLAGQVAAARGEGRGAPGMPRPRPAGAEQPCGCTCAVLDLDGFKAVNDTHGHAAGDLVLRAVVERAARVVGDDGLVARLGGDEFVVWLHCGAPGAPRVQQVLELLRTALAAPVPLADGASASVGVSLGVVDADADGRGGDLAAVLGEADRRMYADKRARRRPVPVG